MIKGVLFVLALCAGAAFAAHAHDVHTSPATPIVARPLSTNPSGSTNRPASPASPASTALPPLPDGVVELKFQEFYQTPIGPRGLAFSDKTRSLHGKRVRVLGYMVRQSAPVASQFLLAPMPLALQEEEYGFAEDLPATLLHVTVPGEEAAVRYTPGLMLLTGVLSIGNRPEPDGRVSAIRLALDPPAAAGAREPDRQCTAMISTNAARIAP